MNYEAKVFLLTLLGSVALAVLVLYIQDSLYTARTGKAPSERVREKMDRAQRRRMTRRTYLTLQILEPFLVLVWVALLFWGRGRIWDKILPAIMSIYGSWLFFETRSRWRKQQANLLDQPSGGPM